MRLTYYVYAITYTSSQIRWFVSAFSSTIPPGITNRTVTGGRAVI